MPGHACPSRFASGCKEAIPADVCWRVTRRVPQRNWRSRRGAPAAPDPSTAARTAAAGSGQAHGPPAWRWCEKCHGHTSGKGSLLRPGLDFLIEMAGGRGWGEEVGLAGRLTPRKIAWQPAPNVHPFHNTLSAAQPHSGGAATDALQTPSVTRATGAHPCARATGKPA